jgi:hypothetical protein
MQTIINPFYTTRNRAGSIKERSNERVTYAKLPKAPVNNSPVPHLTSLYHFNRAGDYGSRKYPGNCGGNLIKDLLLYFNVSLRPSTSCLQSLQVIALRLA